MKRRGFTLIELLIAISLAMLLAMAIMMVATQTQRMYDDAVKRVELFKQLRYAFSMMENEVARMIPSCDLEFFVDRKNSIMTDNGHWDPNEEVRSEVNLAGGYCGDRVNCDRLYTEAPQIVERYYERKNPGGEMERLAAFEIYFRAPVRLGGAVRQANIEYRLVKAKDLVALSKTKVKDPTKIPYTDSQLPRVKAVEWDEELALVKIVRYMEKGEDILRKPMWTKLMRTHLSEICTDVDAFSIEYYLSNPYGGVSLKGGERRPPTAGWFSPSKDRGKTAAEYPALAISEGSRTIYIKRFMYGTSETNITMTGTAPMRGMIRKAIKMDPRSNARTNTYPASLYVPNQFSELGVGDTIYLWPDPDPNQYFSGGEFTIKNKTYRGLVFEEPIKTDSWQSLQKSGIRYKAAYLPMAFRFSLVLAHREGDKAVKNELKRIIRVTTKSDA